MRTESNLYHAMFAGSWYSGDPRTLKRELREWLDAAPPAGSAPVCALIAPHAGYTWSGAVAAHAMRALEGRAVSRVIVMGPTHRVPLHNRISVADATAYRTPMGDLPADTDLAGRLRRYPVFTGPGRAQPGEHSVELQLPWIAETLGIHTPVLTLVCGQLDDPAVHEAAEALRAELDAGAVVIVSTDFTHYGENFEFVPFRDDVSEQLEALDLGAFERICARDSAGFQRYVAKTGATICGAAPLAVLTTMLSPEHTVHRLAYDQSGRKTNDWTTSVSYLAAMVEGRWDPKPAGHAALRRPDGEEDADGTDDDDPEALRLDPSDRAALLHLARGAIETYFETRKRTSPHAQGVPITPGLRREAGVFVTLHKDGELRGCIGEIFPSRAVAKAVVDQALNAAFRDPRFEPVSPEEMGRIRIELSVFQAPREIASAADFIPGTHGILLTHGRRSAVFLPQVATEQGWDRDTTLSHLSLKAGLPSDAWKDPEARFAVFEAIVFGEEE
ncbi:MAG: AmmeMemoRadiSam system protein B [Kiritimatiellae bacterium]|nr:AmmeMemoRadiSam system protein B [Kiritimatiellia bacterium]